MEDLNNNRLYSNSNNYSISNIISIIDLIINKNKQIFLLLLVVIIILAVDYITYYNNLFYSIIPTVPGFTQPQQNIQSNQILFKKKNKKNK